jgi:FAD:protein FMN transferase
MHLCRFPFHAMASPNELQFWARDERHAREVAGAAVGDVRRIETKYSRYRDDSVTARINRGAGGAAVPIDAETVALLRYADRCHQLSGGRFDLTSGVLRRAWDFRAVAPRLPNASALAAARALVDWPGVEWDEHSIRLPRAGMEIDFGGIGKEYAADRAATICRELAIAHGLVNLGGDVRVVGPQLDGTPWRIGIRHPRPRGNDPYEAVAGIDLADGALATSGDYERYIELDGRRYCHVVDALTGHPVGHWQSVSVVAPLCVVAGSGATIAMLLEATAPAFLEAQQLRYLAIASDGSVHGTAAGMPPPRRVGSA